MTAGGILQQGMLSSQNLLQWNTHRLSAPFAGGQLSASQARADALVSSFVDHATDGYSLAAMVGGGLVYRLGRVGTLALGSRLLTPNASLLTSSLLRYGSIGVGFGAEVFTFEAGQRALRVGIGGADSSLLRWSGENGLARGLVGAALTLGSLKGAGVFVNGQNPVFQHLFQDSAMVFAHNVSGTIGITERPRENFAEQMVNAEATLWQMNAGMALVHGAFPTLGQLDRSLDLSIRSRVGAATQGRPTPAGNHIGLPLHLSEPLLAPAGISFGMDRSSPGNRIPDHILAMAGNDSGSGSGKPPSGSGEPPGSEEPPGEERMRIAYGLAGELVRDRLGQEDPEGLARLQRLKDTDVVVVDGDFDHMHVVLDAARIPHIRTPKGEVSERLLEGARAVFVNCGNSFPAESAYRLARFVEQGGLLLSTDWALKHVIEVGFPGFVRHNGRSTGNEVVSIRLLQNDPFFRGFFEGPNPVWWLEGSSYPIQVLDRGRVQVPVYSDELKGAYGNGSVIVRFPYGKGGVYHLVSHLYLQRTETRDARHRDKASTYATSMGASGRTVDFFRRTETIRPDIDLGTVQSATSTTGFVSGVLISQMRQREAGTGFPEATGVRDMMSAPEGRGPSASQLGWKPLSPHFHWDAEAGRYRYQMPRELPQVVIGRLGDEQIMGDGRLSRRHATIRRLSSAGTTGYALTAHNFVTLHRGESTQDLDREQTVWVLPGDVVQLTPSVLFIFDPR